MPEVSPKPKFAMKLKDKIKAGNTRMLLRKPQRMNPKNDIKTLIKSKRIAKTHKKKVWETIQILHAPDAKAAATP